MKLYKLSTNGTYYKSIRFIVALDKAKAYSKYCELECIGDYTDVNVEFICDRNKIIPTIDPIKENYEN